MTKFSQCCDTNDDDDDDGKIPRGEQYELI